MSLLFSGLSLLEGNVAAREYEAIPALEARLLHRGKRHRRRRFQRQGESAHEFRLGTQDLLLTDQKDVEAVVQADGEFEFT